MSIVVLQQATQPLAALDLANRVSNARVGLDPPMVQALMVALAVIRLFQLGKRPAQGLLTKEDQACEALGV